MRMRGNRDDKAMRENHPAAPGGAACS
jgi:hypothetical protein